MTEWLTNVAPLLFCTAIGFFLGFAYARAFVD
jgi:hypothetical protein